MSKAKDNYYELKGYLDRYMGGPVNDVSNYVTELEKKAEMFDDCLRTLAKYIDDNMNDCYLPDTEICKAVYPVNAHKQCVKCMIDYAKNNPTEEAGE